MGRPGTGLAGRAVGIPGRGAPEAPERSAWPAARQPRHHIRRAAEPQDAQQVAPLKFGFEGGRSGPLLPCPALQAVGVSSSRHGSRERWDAALPEWSAPQCPAGARPASSSWSAARDARTRPAGSAEQHSTPERAWEHRSPAIGCLGPERIWPGRGGGGAERDGITGPRFTGAPGAPGCPVASGGRNGNAGRTGAAGASVVSAGAAAAGRTGSGATGAGAIFATGGAGSATRASGWRTGSSRGAGSCSLSSARPPLATRRRRFSTTSSSSELECVFLSVTPSSGNNSRMTFGLTSSSRASSLMRILLILKAPERTAGTPGMEH